MSCFSRYGARIDTASIRKTHPFVVGLLVLVLAGGSACAQSPSPLADAAEKKDRAKAAALLKQGADVNAAQADGMTALHWAAYHDDVSLATQLLKSGASAKAANRYDVTPLALA